jgi:hypothetical protein
VKESQETLDCCDLLSLGPTAEGILVPQGSQEASTVSRFIDPFVAEQALPEQIFGLLRR